MDDTNEIEALYRVAECAALGVRVWGPEVREEVEDSGWIPYLHHAARAVRDAVLASLQARGGMFGAEDMRQALNAVDVLAPLHGHALRKQFAAQGATIAALQQAEEKSKAHARRLEVMCQSETERADAAEARAEQAERERDGEREERVKCAETRREQEARAIAAESANATLRQAVCGPDGVFDLLTSVERDNDGQNDTMSRWIAELRQKLSATPAPEHPDSATLRAIRERADDTETLESVWNDARPMLRSRIVAVAEFIANGTRCGDWRAAEWRGCYPECSGWDDVGHNHHRTCEYSCDEDTGEHVWRRDEQGVCLCGSRTRMLSDSGPSGEAGLAHVAPETVAVARGAVGLPPLLPGQVVEDADSGPSGGGETCGECIGPGELCAEHEAEEDADPSAPTFEPDATAPGLAACVPVEGEHETCDECGAIVGGNPACAACCEWVRKDAMRVKAEPETLRTHVNRAKAALASDAHRIHCTQGGCKYGDEDCPMRAQEPAEAEDWARLERYFSVRGLDDDEEVRAALARLKQARQRAADRWEAHDCGDVAVEASRRAAEEMRERCAKAAPHIVEGVLGDLAERQGVLEGIDAEVMDEIRSDLLRIVEYRIRSMPLKP